MQDYETLRRIMVDTQVRPNDVTEYPIIEAFLHVPRERFAPAGLEPAAYLGENLPLGGGRVMLEPRTLAKMLDALDVRPDDLALVVGAGTGYSAAIMARLAAAVVAVEEDDALAAEARSALADAGADTVVLEQGPLVEGAPSHGPYDVLLIEGGVETVPEALVEQVNEGGRIGALFVSGEFGEVRIGHRRAGATDWRSAFNAGAPLLQSFRKPAVFTL